MAVGGRPGRSRLGRARRDGSAFERPFWLATIIVASIFLFGAAIGHVRQLVASHNRSPGNAGAILYTDILIPLIVIALYAAT